MGVNKTGLGVRDVQPDPRQCHPLVDPHVDLRLMQTVADNGRIC
jgi:hypothetical protein